MAAFDLLIRVETFTTIFHAVTCGLRRMNVQLIAFSRQDGEMHNSRWRNSVNKYSTGSTVNVNLASVSWGKRVPTPAFENFPLLPFLTDDFIHEEHCQQNAC